MDASEFIDKSILVATKIKKESSSKADIYLRIRRFMLVNKFGFDARDKFTEAVDTEFN